MLDLPPLGDAGTAGTAGEAGDEKKKKAKSYFLKLRGCAPLQGCACCCGSPLQGESSLLFVFFLTGKKTKSCFFSVGGWLVGCLFFFHYGRGGRSIWRFPFIVPVCLFGASRLGGRLRRPLVLRRRGYFGVLGLCRRGYFGVLSLCRRGYFGVLSLCVPFVFPLLASALSGGAFFFLFISSLSSRPSRPSVPQRRQVQHPSAASPASLSGKSSILERQVQHP